jgi:AcrR family transcriptional regulator
VAAFDRELRARSAKIDARRVPRQRPSSRMRASEAQRMRILSATVEVVSEVGAECATVTQIVRRAGVSSATFYALFEGRQDCMAAVFEEAVAIATERVCTAYDPHAAWVDRVRASLLALLEFVEEEPELARLCVAHALASPTILTHRGELLDRVTRVIAEGHSASGASSSPPPFAAHFVLGGTLGLIHTRLISLDPRSLVELVNPLMSMVVLPYLGAASARKEQERPLAARSAPRRRRTARDPLASLVTPLTYRTLAVLVVIDAEPGLSNCEVGERAGVKDQGQISRLLARLLAHGLAENTSKGQPRGEPNAWILTLKGAEFIRALARL